MSTTGTTNFNLQLNELVEEAYERAGAELRTGYELRTARRSLNLLTIEWANRGINLWTIEQGSIPLNQAQITYALPIDTIDLMDMVVRTDSGLISQSDININRISSSTYATIPNKNAQGRPIQVWIDLLEGREPSWLHPSMKYEQAQQSRLLINVPPEHAKSTVVTVNYSTYRIALNPNVRIIVVSKTLLKAREFVYAIKQRLSHPRWLKLQTTYGPEGGWKADSDTWRVDTVYLGSDARNSSEKDLVNYGKSLGLKAIIEEGQNARRPVGSVPAQPNESLGEAFGSRAKMGTIGR